MEYPAEVSKTINLNLDRIVTAGPGTGNKTHRHSVSQTEERSLGVDKTTERHSTRVKLNSFF